MRLPCEALPYTSSCVHYTKKHKTVKSISQLFSKKVLKYFLKYSKSRRRSADGRVESLLERLENALHGLLGVVVGERLIVGAQRQREGNALVADRDRRAGVHVEQLAALEVLPTGGEDARRELGDRDIGGADDGDVARHGRETRQRRVDRGRAAGGEQFAEPQLRRVELRVHAVVRRGERMDLAEHAQQLAAGVDFRAAAGVIGRIVVLRLKRHVRYAQTSEDALDRALELEEVHAAAVAAEAQQLRLVGHAVRAGEVDLADLVETHGLVAVVIVAREDLEHGRQDGRAHDGGVLAERVEDLHGIAQRGVCRQTDLVVVRRADERVGDDLAVAERAGHGADAALRLLRVGVAAAGGLAAHERAGDVVVAVEAGDLFGDVGVVLHIAAPGRDDDRVAVELEAEREHIWKDNRRL